MPADVAPLTPDDNALAFAGRMLSVTRIRVLKPDPAAIATQLATWAQRMAQALQGMPVIIDSDIKADLPDLLRQLSAAGMQPIGISEGPLATAGRAANLPVLPGDGHRPSKRATRKAEASPTPARKPKDVYRSTRVVVDPVRSGQQIHAQGTDLVVLNSVSAGAELIADGCIHVYGRLSGRAIAGASGDEAARIFCHRMEAELVAIAGIYAVADQMKDLPSGAPAQAWLADGQLHIERLE